ncbi:type I polyketide synthase, partial [Pelosinus baikalensis]
KIEYKQVDVTDKKGIAHLIQSITKEYGNLHGIIHGAGIIQDNFIFKKSKEEMQNVISPKVSGLVNLDEASKGLPLDFFIFFSSIAGSLGNAGQSDYSAANAFMDSYANYRNELVGLKERYGRTLSVNWPLWKEGGMHVDEEVAKSMLQKTGMLPLETAAGIQALYRSLASGAEQVMVLEGECQRLREFFTGFSPTKEATPSVTQEYKMGFTIEEDLFQEKISDYFRKIIASTIKVPMKEIDAEDPMDEYGIDSIIAMQITSNLEEIFGSLPKTLFFEYQNIKELTAYFFECHSKQLLDLLGIREEETTVLREFEPIIESVKSHEGSNCSRPRFIASREESRGKEEKNNGDIAIIGVSGRYPGAKNIGELWINLQAGRDCITEVPKERWDYHAYYDEDKNKSGKTYCKWGGFLENSDRFDSLFFAISPEEAKFMNPQDRLFMETVWNLFESAGYTRESLKHQYQTRVGVYVGSMYQDYDSKSSSINELSTFMCSSIANRISQYFNLQGPSVVIDSMSSSSAIAIHMACESLIRGECRLAIAGGVNLLYLQKYLRLSKIKMIGSHIHSRSFGDGDGYLPAEGVGAVLLKPLTQAIKDGDRILAVIKSSVTNHGGHTNGAATPNINAQIQLIEDNFKKTGMDPRTISYVEAAANGFPVGDLIEISALDKAFHKFTNDQQFCAIGSIKANIGHAEAASGVSQLTKVILQLQHQQLVPAIGAETLNPNIHFEKTPFYIQRKLTEWKRPMVWIDGEEREVPRRATVSSFGAGGSNVHLIVEEYIPSPNETLHRRSQISPQIVVFSAKNQERLVVVCQQMLEFIECKEELILQDIAYTLQVGREAMEARVAMVVNNRQELIQSLKEYLKHPKKREACVPIFAVNLEEEHEMKNLFSGNTGEKFSQVLLAEKNLNKIAMYWSQGGKIPWDSFHEQNEVRKIFLPTYPFKECQVVSI